MIIDSCSHTEGVESRWWKWLLLTDVVQADAQPGTLDRLLISAACFKS